MLAESFNQPSDFVYPGDSGIKVQNKWQFSNQLTSYKINPKDWFMSEKIDGVRCFFSLENGFQSRSNNTFNTPDWFCSNLKEYQKLNNCIIDGELSIYGKDASFVSGTIRRKNSEKDWDKVIFYVFDIIGIDKIFRDRTKILYDLVKDCKDVNIVYLPQYVCKNMDDAYQFYKQIVKQNKEGLVFKNPNSFYEFKRSNNLLKWKPIPTMEGKVIGFHEGSGKFKNKLGTFEIELSNNITFKLSGKMTDEFRSQYVFKNHKLSTILSEDVPHLNDIVTFEYMTLTIHGIPRQAVFIGKRYD